MKDENKICVISCFKNEAHIFNEWLEHYLSEGVDHFHLIDNGSTDNFLEKLQPYINRNIVTLYSRPEQHIQSAHLNEVLHSIKYDYKWAILVDLDEFMFPAEFNNFKEYLADKDDYTSITAYWTNFASRDEYEQPESVIDSFLWKWKRFPRYVDDTEWWIETKQIVRPTAITRIHIHEHDVPDDIKNDFRDLHGLKIFHYQLQSREYFDKVKATRGDACDASQNYARNDAYFRDRDRREIYDDTLKVRRQRKRNENS